MRPTMTDARAAAVEFGMTTVFMATVFTLVHWGIGSTPPDASANEMRLRVAAVSILVGLIIVGFATSPPGRFSGAHMNPAITLGMFAAGHLSARRVLPYLVAQAAGSIAAAALLRVAWGPSVSEGPARWAVVQPGQGWTGAYVAAVEAMTLLVIVGLMCWMTASRPRWRAAWVVGGLFGLQGALLGTATGGSANPVRQLGPALFSGELRLLAVYLVAPVAGGMLAGWAAHRLRHARNVRPPAPRIVTPRPRIDVIYDRGRGTAIRREADDRDTPLRHRPYDDELIEFVSEGV
ncbi:glycerol uptake facilitator protein [Actinoplanes xinjiangensis]|uniref:Glycerol uptake facilitator protein n=2 Tax=Actinoplanes xinjiangensis TaxID=512350 RepID=A0A316F713_9ACTN|nr:glycerol uptake facilitator protein [Actinoplanes xinjiangensis]